MKGTKLSSLEKHGNKHRYLGRWWSLNTPIKSSRKDKKMMVLATKLIDGQRCVKLIHFGAVGYGHNYSNKARKNYLKRSGMIRNKRGELTKSDPWSANYWARKILWSTNTKPLKPSRAAAKRIRKAA